MYSLQELIEHGYVDSITTNGTHLGDGYTIVVKLSRYSIGKITIDVGIDEYLDDAVTLINGIIDIQEKLNQEGKRKKEPHTIRPATSEELKDLFKAPVDETPEE